MSKFDLMMRILIFGDIPGIPQLMRHIPIGHLVGIVGAVIRPQYHEKLAAIAELNKLPLVIQPKVGSADYAGFIDSIMQLEPDIVLVNSYSMILQQDVLSIARLGGINIHGALLPGYRGCNPTQWAILNRETKVGVTMHEISPGLDEGAIIDQRVVPLLFEDTWKTVNARIATATDVLINDNLQKVLAGVWQAKEQDISKAAYWARRTPEDGLFEWAQPVVDIYNKIRALLPPIPPALYIDSAGVKVYIDQQLTPFGVTAQKYGLAGKGAMATDHVLLRPLRQEESPLLYDGITNPEQVFLNAPFHSISDVDHQSWFESMLTKRTDLVVFVIVDIATQQVIGTCQLFNINWHYRSAELQMLLTDARYHEQDSQLEAVKLLTRFGFTDLNLHRISLHLFANNISCINFYEKCGFVKETLLKEAACVEGSWCDVVGMSELNKHD